MPAAQHFSPALFDFLRELAANNRREWFAAHRQVYEQAIREPAQRFISDFGPRLRRISPEFTADPRPVGGSLFRIHRDIRFSPDKTPYKTHVGIQFRHKRRRDVHAPGFYLHLAPGNVFAGVGCWHPDSTALAGIREALIAAPEDWRRVLRGKRFRDAFTLEGESLKRAPRGVDPGHPLIEDLKRKDFVAVARLDEKSAVARGFLDRYTAVCRAGSALVEFLCRAVGVPF